MNTEKGKQLCCDLDPTQDLLQEHRIDTYGIHWSPHTESRTRHPALLQHYTQHKNWVLIRAFKRELGLIIGLSLVNSSAGPFVFLDLQYRWVRLQAGSSTPRHLQVRLGNRGARIESLDGETEAFFKRELAAAIVTGNADTAPGSRTSRYQI